MRAFGVIVDDCAKVHLGPANKPGGKRITVNITEYGMNFDVWKCYLRIKKPTASDLIKYQTVELTPKRAYNPQRHYARHVNGQAPVDLEG